MMVRLFSRDAVAKSPCTCGSLPGIYSRSEYEVAPIAKKLKLGKLKDTFKGITLSDVINAAIGIAGLTV